MRKQSSSPLWFCFPFASKPTSGHPHCAPQGGALLCEPPRDAGSLKAIRGSLPVSQARAVLRCSPRKQSFFFFPLKTKRYIYIYLFFHVELRQNKSVWPQSVDSPQPQAEDQGVSPTGWDSVGGLPRDIVGGAGWWAFPFGEAPGRGSWPRSRQHSLGWKPAPGGPALVQRPHRFLFGSRNLREGGCGDHTGHRHSERCQARWGGARLGQQGQQKRTLLSPCDQPLTPAALQSRRSPRSERRAAGVGLAWSSALANYCDISAPLPHPVFGRVLQDRPTTLSSDPNLEAAHPHPRSFFKFSSSDHSNHFGDLIMYIDKCKL